MSILSAFTHSKHYFYRLLPTKKQDQERYKNIAKLTWPSFAELFLSSFFQSIDMAMVGQLGTAALAGVGLTNQPFMLIISLFAAINVGTTTMISWNVGAGRNHQVVHIAKQTILVNFIFGLLIGAISIYFAPQFMAFMGKEDAETLAYATGYFRNLSWGMVFLSFNLGVSAAFRGCGQTWVPMTYNVVSNGVNVLFNYILIYGHFGFPAYGVDGAAIATSIARGFASIMAIGFLLFWKNSPIRLRINEKWKLDFLIIKDMLSIGVPTAIEQFILQMGLIIYAKILFSLGKSAYAAHQIASNINSMIFSISQAFSMSNTALVGRCVGADDYQQAKTYTIYTGRLARVVTALVAIGFIALSRPLCLLFTNSEEVIAIAKPIFYFMAAVQFMQSIQLSTAGALRGAGDTMYPLYATIFGVWVLRLSMAALFIYVFQWGLIGAWASFLVDQTARMLIVRHRFNSGKWMQMKSIKEAKAAAFREAMSKRSH